MKYVLTLRTYHQPFITFFCHSMQLILDPHLYEDLFKFKVTPVFFIRGVPLDDEDKTELHLEEV
jgi:hypothetical protein